MRDFAQIAFEELTAVAKPLTVDEIYKRIEFESNNSRKKAIAILRSDERFILIDSKETYALSSWDFQAYEGAYNEISKRIALDGGVSSVKAIMEEFPIKFKLTQGFLESQLSDQGSFTIDGDKISIAIEGDFAAKNPEIIKGTVPTNNGWGQKVKISKWNLANHSFGVSRHVAYQNGINPGDKLLVQVETEPAWNDQASIIWRIKNAGQVVNIGKLAALLNRNGHEVGDELILVPTPKTLFIYDSDFKPTNLSKPKLRVEKAIKVRDAQNVLGKLL